MTAGNIYEVLNRDGEMLQMKDDFGDVAWRYAGRFEVVESPILNVGKLINPKDVSVKVTK